MKVTLEKAMQFDGRALAVADYRSPRRILSVLLLRKMQLKSEADQSCRKRTPIPSHLLTENTSSTERRPVGAFAESISI